MWIKLMQVNNLIEIIQKIKNILKSVICIQFYLTFQISDLEFLFLQIKVIKIQLKNSIDSCSISTKQLKNKFNTEKTF